MGQKVHPHGFRLGYIYDWNSKWYADRNYTDLLHEDLGIRRKITRMLPDAGISKVDIERNANPKILFMSNSFKIASVFAGEEVVSE